MHFIGGPSLYVLPLLLLSMRWPLRPGFSFSPDFPPFFPLSLAFRLVGMSKLPEASWNGEAGLGGKDRMVRKSKLTWHWHAE